MILVRETVPIDLRVRPNSPWLVGAFDLGGPVMAETERWPRCPHRCIGILVNYPSRHYVFVKKYKFTIGGPKCNHWQA